MTNPAVGSISVDSKEWVGELSVKQLGPWMDYALLLVNTDFVSDLIIISNCIIGTIFPLIVFKFCFHHNTSSVVSKRKQRKAHMTPQTLFRRRLFILQVYF